MSAMTVGMLRKAIEGLSDDMEVVVEMTDGDENDYIAGLRSANVEYRCADNSALFLSASEFDDKEEVETACGNRS